MEASTAIDINSLPACAAQAVNALKRRGVQSVDSHAKLKCSRLDATDAAVVHSQRAGQSGDSRQNTEQQAASISGNEAALWGHGPVLQPLLRTLAEPQQVHHGAQARPPASLLPSPMPSGKAGTLVLDMDKTLIFKEWRLQPFDRRPQVVYRPDFNFHITYRGYPVLYHVKKRPFLDIFLARAAALFEVVLFTASESIVTLPVVKQLDPQGTLIHHVLCRDACTEREGLYVKDLARLGRDLSRTVIIDDNPDSFLWQRENAVLVPEFCGWEEHDQELLRLMPLLDMLASADDMRTVATELAGTLEPLDDDDDDEPSPEAPAAEEREDLVQQQQPGTPETAEDVQEEQSEDSVVYY